MSWRRSAGPAGRRLPPRGLVQGFFAALIAGGDLKAAEPARGIFAGCFQTETPQLTGRVLSASKEE